MNPRWALSVCALLSAGGVLSVGAGAPELERLSADAHRSTRVFDRSGHPLAESLSPRDTRNRPVALENVSPSVVAALLATEDRRFYEHGGIDLRATLRAALANLHALRVEQGGSTLTQQLARLLRVDAAVERGESPPGRTVSQKLLEAHLALRLEQAHSKPAILQAFLNRAPFGNSAVGIDAAAWRYFNVSADALSPAQAAMLVALIRGPSFYDPFAHPDRLRERTHRVLDGMHQTGHLTDLQWQRARAEPLNPQRHSTERSSVHALALARREWRGRGGGRWPDQLHLTVDRTLESRIRRVVQDEAPKIYSRGARSSAVVVIDVPSGEVLAAVGATFEDNPHWGEYSAVTAERQPGSALKPFLYGLALEKGLSAAELAADIERPFADTWGIYKPRNYDELYHGPVRFRAALAQSLNVAAVDVLDRVGQPEFYSTLEAFGLTTLERRSAHYGLGIVLGSSPVHLIDLTNAYAALARRGEWRTWTVLKPSEARLQDRDPPRQVFSERSAFVLADILADGNARAEQFGIRSVLTTPYWAAAKTGTSKGYRDNWTLGFTQRYALGVWVGDPTGKPMHHISGVEGAGTIWRRVMDLLTEGRSAGPKPPPGLKQVRVCAVSGEPIGPHCEGGLDEWFHDEHTHAGSCSFHREARIDPASDGLVPDGCRVPGASVERVTVYPSPYDAWAVSAGTGRSARVSPQCRQPSSGSATVALLSPAPREALHLDPDVPLDRQALTLRAHVQGSVSPLRFMVDGEVVGTVEPPYEWVWPLAPGLHEIQAVLSDTVRSEVHQVSVR